MVEKISKNYILSKGLTLKEVREHLDWSGTVMGRVLAGKGTVHENKRVRKAVAALSKLPEKPIKVVTPRHLKLIGLSKDSLRKKMGIHDTRVTAAMNNEPDRPKDRVDLAGILAKRGLLITGMPESKEAPKSAPEFEEERREAPSTDVGVLDAIMALPAEDGKAYFEHCQRRLDGARESIGDAITDSYDDIQWGNRVDTETVPLTLELAKRVALMSTCGCDRPYDGNRALDLTEGIKNKARPFEWAVVHMPDGTYLRVNGGTTSSTFGAEPEHIQDDMVVHLDRFPVTCMREVLALWRSFDKEYSSRSKVDLARMFLHLHPELEGLKPAQIVGLVNMMATQEWGEKKLTRTKIEHRLCFAEANIPFLTFIRDVLAKCNNKGSSLPLVRVAVAPIYRAMFKTYKVNHEDSVKFWHALLPGDPKELPTAALRTQILSIRTADQSVSNRSKQTFVDVTHHLWLEALCVQSWNQWRRGDTADEVLEKEIQFTPTKIPGEAGSLFVRKVPIVPKPI